MPCKDKRCYQDHGFSPLCKYCEDDGKCPECGAQMHLGDDLNGPMWICPKGHCFDLYGKSLWNELFR